MVCLFLRPPIAMNDMGHTGELCAIILSILIIYNFLYIANEFYIFLKIALSNNKTATAESSSKLQDS